VNLYFLRFAKMMVVKDARREGHSYIEPSWIASQIYGSQSSPSLAPTMSHRLGASFYYGVAVEVLVVFYGVAILDDALGAAVCWRDAVTRR
jgi:hypothetical protein